ncbi:hypothetical protein PsYK624_005510 [Phanerochaete sordida]|uniref:Uncharacterized protein n=1 Tax=Phanerochaete sordida TaxID=48140 RepID=A0A9P3L723_9APHY|nr:hypothetical protein PsYK624_005510 [Phanerochaete sordida]
MHGHNNIWDVVPRAHDDISHPVARGLFDGLFGGGGGDGKTTSDSGGLLGLPIPSLPTPSLSLPGISDLLGLPTSSSSSSTTASASSSSHASSSSATSSSAASSSSSSSSSSTLSTPTPTPTPTPDNTQAPASSHDRPTSTVFQTVGASAAAESSGVPLPPKSFMQNKPLCISVITFASIIGLVILLIIGTWAVRRRRRDKLHDEASQFKTEDLVGGGHGHDDIEKGSQGMFGRRDDDVISKVEMAAGARSVHRVPTNRSTGTTTTETFVNPYNQAFDPAKVGYGAGQGKPYDDAPMPPPAAQPYYDGRDYVDLQRGAYHPGAPAPAYDAPPYRSATPLYDYHTTPGQPFARTPSPAADPAQYPQARQLTPAPPPFLSVDVNAAAAPMFGPSSALSFAGSAESAGSGEAQALPRRSSLLNGPVAPVSPKGSDVARKRSSSHSKALDPTIPPVPVAPPLPEEFGNPELSGEPRELKIVNA